MRGERLLEIRTYRIHPGKQERLAQRMKAAIPMLDRYGIDVVWMGPSAADDEHYVLLRSFDSLENRKVLEDAFYGSEEWRNGPRDGILELIHEYHTVVLHSTESAIASLAASLKDL
jgi:NIPSNAP